MNFEGRRIAPSTASGQQRLQPICADAERKDRHRLDDVIEADSTAIISLITKFISET
jgi:hypothetical protein